MRKADTHRLGYHRVDGDPNVAVLVNTMDATSQWRATRLLRDWERRTLDLTDGQRLLDVGCGRGEAVLALGEDLGETGEIVGVDISAEMLEVARRLGNGAPCRVRFSVGDACSLDAPDDSFDAVRSERVLQWISEPGAAVAEMARVVRPGGRVSLIDTDWSTFAIDVGDEALARLVRQHLSVERNRPSHVGRRLSDLVRSVGLDVADHTSETHTWNSWDPDETPAPHGCFSMNSFADSLVEAGDLPADDRYAFVSTITSAARQNRFAMCLTMFAVVAVAPTVSRSG